MAKAVPFLAVTRSVFGQIYHALHQKGAVQRSGRDCEIFRGAERWWKVDFKNEHVSDAGGETLPLPRGVCSTAFVAQHLCLAAPRRLPGDGLEHLG